MTAINIIMQDNGFCSITLNYSHGHKTMSKADVIPFTEIQKTIEDFKRSCEGGQK